MPTDVEQNPLVVKSGQGVTILSFAAEPVLTKRALDEVEQRCVYLTSTGGRETLTLNVHGVKRLSASCLSRLIALNCRIEAAGKKMVLCGLGPQIEATLEAAGVGTSLLIRSASSRVSEGNEPVPECRSRCPARAAVSGKKDAVVILHDPRPVWAERTAARLARELDDHNVIHASEFAELKDLCNSHPDAVAVLPLVYRPGDVSGKTVSRDIERGFVVERLPADVCHQRLVVYGDGRHLSSASCCRAIEAGVTRILDENSADFGSELREGVRELLEERERDLAGCAELIRRFAERRVVGQSPAIMDVFRRAARVAEFPEVPVIVSGETGTGKQYVAEAIHAMDQRRRNGPCHTVNCSAINRELAESELFGHVKGAFTGSEEDRAGKFRSANGGTLILDEIGDLHIELQPKLLRVLQEGRVSPVGADREYPIDVRVIAVTNRDLEKRVADGHFRADLFARLNGFSIEIPPLRERPEDIEIQAVYLLSRYRAVSRGLVIGFSGATMEALFEFPWPGNTRQLENMVRETLINSPKGWLVEIEELPRWFIETLANQASPRRTRESGKVEKLQRVRIASSQSGAARESMEEGLSLKQAIRRFERQFIEAVLEKNGGSRTRTAAALGISRRALSEKLRKYRQ